MTRCMLLFTAWISCALAGPAEPLAPSPAANPQIVTRSGATGNESANAQPLLAESAHGFGVVEGTVAYQSDPQRPWRLARYYAANSKQGWLAEAVVALESPHLVEAAPKRPPQTYTMDQLNFQFVPETLAIRAGDSVKILNSDDALHNVMTSDGSKPFNVSLAKGQEFMASFDQGGGLANPVRLGCLFHSQMHAWVYVFDHPWFTVTKTNGQFRFENIPAGRYTLRVVHPAGKLHSNRDIEVQADGTASLAVRLSPDDLTGSK